MIDLDGVRRQLDLERRTVAQEGWVLESLPHVSRLRGAKSSRHMIAFSALSDDVADEVIVEQAAHYRGLCAEVEWKVYRHDSPRDLLQRVERYGFTPGPREAVLMLDLRDRPKWINENPRYAVTRVETKDQVTLYGASAEAIFERGHGGTAEELLASISSGSKQLRGYMVVEGNVAASIGRLYTHDNSAFGGLYGGGTLIQYRCRGLYQAIVAARALDALKSGARYLLVDALPTSEPILEKLGFVHLC